MATKCYIRFGRIPPNEISKAHHGDAIIREEQGVSVWNCIEVNDVFFPVLLDNPSEACAADYFYCLP